MAESPSPNGSNGKREASGRFAKGNPGGPGNPYARRVAQLRAVVLAAVTDDDLKAIVASLIARAKEGDLAAAREVFNRLLGSPADAADRQEQAEQLEKTTKKKLRLAERLVDIKELDLL